MPVYDPIFIGNAANALSSVCFWRQRLRCIVATCSRPLALVAAACKVTTERKSIIRCPYCSKPQPVVEVKPTTDSIGLLWSEVAFEGRLRRW